MTPEGFDNNLLKSSYFIKLAFFSSFLKLFDVSFRIFSASRATKLPLRCDNRFFIAAKL